MGRKGKLISSFADLKIDNQVRDPNSSRLANQPQSSSAIVSPPSMCHGSESCGCFCHYAQDDPPPCYNCAQHEAEDYTLAQKVLLGKKDSLSRGNARHINEYMMRDEFGIVIPKYRKKMNKKALKLSKVLDDEASTHPFGAKDSLRLRRELSHSQVENISSILLAANKSVSNRVSVNNIFNEYPHMTRSFSQDELDSRELLQCYHTPSRNQIPAQCRQSRTHYVKDNFGLEVRKNANKGCAVS